jgi:hypothetical protein
LRVRGRKFIIGQFRFANPLERRAAERPRFAGNQFANEKFQANGFLGVGVRDFFKQIRRPRNFNAEFLADFADETLLESFIRLALAAGKFPKSAEMRVGTWRCVIKSLPS